MKQILLPPAPPIPTATAHPSPLNPILSQAQRRTKRGYAKSNYPLLLPRGAIQRHLQAPGPLLGLLPLPRPHGTAPRLLPGLRLITPHSREGQLQEGSVHLTAIAEVLALVRAGAVTADLVDDVALLDVAVGARRAVDAFEARPVGEAASGWGVRDALWGCSWLGAACGLLLLLLLLRSSRWTATAGLASGPAAAAAGGLSVHTVDGAAMRAVEEASCWAFPLPSLRTVIRSLLSSVSHVERRRCLSTLLCKNRAEVFLGGSSACRCQDRQDDYTCTRYRQGSRSLCTVPSPAVLLPTSDLVLTSTDR